MTPTTLYMATDQGVWKSTDGGGSWSRAWGALGALVTSAIAVAPSQPSVLYAATSMGVYQSLDGGASWALFSAGLVATDISALGVDPNDPRTAFDATWDGDVFNEVPSRIDQSIRAPWLACVDGVCDGSTSEPPA